MNKIATLGKALRVQFIFLLLGLGTTAVPVELHAAIIRGEDIKASLASHVETQMPWPPGTVRLDFPYPVRDRELPGKAIRLAVTNRPEEDYIGDTIFTVKFFSGEDLVREERVRVGLEVLKEVVVAARPLPRNQEIAAEDVRVLRKWVKRATAQAISAPEEVIGKAARINLRPDTEITKNIIKEPVLVKRGGLVRILLDNGGLIITTLGVSEENGIDAALVKVKNVASNKIIYARVAGEALVRVEF